MRKKKIEDVEEQELESVITADVEDDHIVEAIEYFDGGIDNTVQPVDSYDAVYYKIIDHPRYYIGTVAVRARRALLSKGKLFIDTNGCVVNIDNLILTIEFCGFLHIENKSGILVFEKDE